MWSLVDFPPKVYWDCKPKPAESLNVLLCSEIHAEAWDAYLQHLKELLVPACSAAVQACKIVTLNSLLSLTPVLAGSWIMMGAEALEFA
jgi:hypothetical protein